MKNLLSVRGMLIAVGTLLGILVFVFSFLVSVKSVNSALGVTTTTIENGVIWGCGSVKIITGSTEITKTIDPKHGALLLPLIGAILALVGGLGACLLKMQSLAESA